MSAKDFNYVDAYTSFMVAINRQKYAPLDGSSVFKSMDDLTYYTIVSKTPVEDLQNSSISAEIQELSNHVSEYVKNLKCYAYVGQIVTVVDSGVKTYKILEVPELSDISSGINTDELFERIDDSRIFIKNFDRDGNEITAFSNLSAVKMTFDDYAELVESDKIYELSNVMFIVSSDCPNAYNEKIINVKAGTEPTDAVNYAQLTSIVAGDISPLCVGLSTQIRNLSIGLSTEIDNLSVGLSTEIQNLSTGLSTEIGKLSAGLSTAISSKIYVKNNDNAGYGNLSVIKIERGDYENLVLTDSLTALSNVVFIIVEHGVNAYGGKVENIADATNPSDAVTLKQLSNVNESATAAVTNLSVGLTEKVQLLLNDIAELSNMMVGTNNLLTTLLSADLTI